MKLKSLSVSCAVAAVLAGAALPARAAKCPPDSVKVGPVCVDKYEASAWQVPATNPSGKSNRGLVSKIKGGEVKLGDLSAGGATQLSPSSSCLPSFPGSFPFDGNWIPTSLSPPSAGIYAVSLAGVPPTACVTWFQAEQLCRLSGKRLLTNREWQAAAAGTPDPGNADDGSTTCNTNSADVANTGSRGSCHSNWGAYDMVGNVWEWVADWGPMADGCTDWQTELGFTDGDVSCMGNLGSTSSYYHIPGALARGGSYGFGTRAGVFAVYGHGYPSDSGGGVGFRCAR